MLDANLRSSVSGYLSTAAPGQTRAAGARTPVGGYSLFTDDALAGCGMVPCRGADADGRARSAGALTTQQLRRPLPSPTLRASFRSRSRCSASGLPATHPNGPRTLRPCPRRLPVRGAGRRGQGQRWCTARRNALDALAASAVEQALGAEMRGWRGRSRRCGRGRSCSPRRVRAKRRAARTARTRSATRAGARTAISAPRSSR